MLTSVAITATLASYGLAAALGAKDYSSLAKRAQPVYPAAPDGMFYLSIGTASTLSGSGPGSFIYFAFSTETCAPLAPVEDGQACSQSDFTWSIIETGAFDSCDELQGSQKDDWGENLPYRGSANPDNYADTFSTHAFGRCSQDTINFFRQADGSFRAESSDGIGVARCFEAERGGGTSSVGWDAYCPEPFAAETALRLLECSGNICL